MEQQTANLYKKMKIGIFLNYNPILPIYSFDKTLKYSSPAIVDILIPQFLKNNDEIIFLDKFYKRKFEVNDELKHIKMLTLNDEINAAINNQLPQDFKYLHKNKQKILNVKVDYSQSLKEFDLIIIGQRYAFFAEFTTMKFIYDCLDANVPTYVLDMDLVMDNQIKKWGKTTNMIEITKNLNILSTMYTEKERFIHISYGYRKEWEKEINNEPEYDMSFVGLSKISYHRNRSNDIIKWINNIYNNTDGLLKNKNFKIKICGNWENYVDILKNVEISGSISLQENFNLLNNSKSTVHFYIPFYKNVTIVGNRIYDAAHAGTILFLNNKNSLPPYLSELNEFVMNDSNQYQFYLNNMSKFDRNEIINMQRNLLRKFTPEYEFKKFLNYHNENYNNN